MDKKEPSEESIEAAVRLWRLPEFSDRELDVPFAYAIARAIQEAKDGVNKAEDPIFDLSVFI